MKAAVPSPAVGEVGLGTGSPTFTLLRRAFLRAVSSGMMPGVTGIAAGSLAARPCLASAEESAGDDNDLVKRLLGGAAILSPRVHLDMPAVFPNGTSVPLTLTVDSPMTEADFVRQVHVLAPRNPIITVARFQFTPQSGRAEIITRIRLAEEQFVLAVAEMNDGTLLMARSWVKVDINGCN